LSQWSKTSAFGKTDYEKKGKKDGDGDGDRDGDGEKDGDGDGEIILLGRGEHAEYRRVRHINVFF
jgi:hypothetical protein